MEMNEIMPKIKRLQEEKGWNMADLARNSAVPKTTIISLCERNNVPTVPTLASLCKAFGITMAQFFNEDDTFDILTEEKVRIMKKWDTLTDKQRKALLDLIDSM